MGNEFLLKAPIGLRAPHAWYMPHEFPVRNLLAQERLGSKLTVKSC